MFRKNVTAAGTHQLGGKDVKKLKADLSRSFASLTDEQRDALFPPKAAVTQLKLSNRSLVYCIEGVAGGSPLFFDPSGHGDKLLPTVYALSILPGLLPVLHTYSEVTPKVLGGADLFLQGVILPEGGAAALADFLAGSARALAVPGNPVPFAVGTMAVSKTEALREGMKGRGLTLLHSFGDLLWQLGEQEPPNDGFTPSRVFPSQGAAGGNGNGDDTAAVDAAERCLGGLSLANDEVESSGANGGGNSNENGEHEPRGAAAAEAEEEGAAGANTDGEAPAAANALGMDELLEAAVLGGLHALKSGELPMMTSDFYAKCMQPLKPDGVVFDFKQTRYKKLSKLLDRFEKDKVLTQKQIRKQDHITAVDRTHPAYLAWRGMPGSGAGAGGGGEEAGRVAGEGGGGDAAGSAAKGPAAGGRSASGPTTQVELLYKPPSSLRPVFPDAGKEAMFSEAEVLEALESYARSQGLAGDGSVKVDHLLASSLYGKKEAPAEGTAVPAAALGRRLLDKLPPWHRIRRRGEDGKVLEVVRRGKVQPISILVERRRGHNVTAVTRVEGFAFVADELSSAFARRLKTASSVSKLPGKAESDSEILLQGDLLKPVAAYFTDVAGIGPEFLELQNKLKK